MIDRKTTMAVLEEANTMLRRFALITPSSLCKNEDFYYFCIDEINYHLWLKGLPHIGDCFKDSASIRRFIQETLYVATDIELTPFESKCIDGLACGPEGSQP